MITIWEKHDDSLYRRMAAVLETLSPGGKALPGGGGGLLEGEEGGGVVPQIGGREVVASKMQGRWGAYSFAACCSHLAIGRASFTRGSG